MALPSYLVRRDGGRYHFQIRLGMAMARSLESSHLRFSLRTADQRQARRRLLDCLEWAYDFKDAPDLEAAGAVLVRNLEKAVTSGPPTPEMLPSRLILEEYTAEFIRQSRDRDFAWVARLPGLIHLLRTFTAQNAGADAPDPNSGQSTSFVAQRQLRMTDFEVVNVVTEGGPSRPSVVSPRVNRAEELLESFIARLDERIQLQTPIAHGTSQNATASADVPTHRGDSPFEAVPMSAAIERFLNQEAKRNGSRKSDARFGPILRFMQDRFNDAALSSLTSESLELLDKALPEIPGLKGCPLALRRSLHGRFQLAQVNGWSGLERITTTTLDLRYRTPLRIFFKWAIAAKLFSGPVPIFTAYSEEVLAPLPRDRLQDEEILRFISAPLFTGCDGPRRIWTPGKYLIQNDLYWIFLILLLTGMRTGEPPQIKLDDIVCVNEISDAGESLRIHFFDMRPYDPAKGRQAVKNLKHLKRSDFARVIPIHPLLLDLGLLKRVEHLRSIGETRLFPSIDAHISSSGEVRWGKTISKAFSHARKRPGIELSRANITLYSTRQLMADWLDSLKTPQRVRNRVMGHTNDTNAADEYGSKGMMPLAQASCITELETPIIQQIRAVLMGAIIRATAGELILIDVAPRRKLS